MARPDKAICRRIRARREIEWGKYFFGSRRLQGRAWGGECGRAQWKTLDRFAQEKRRLFSTHTSNFAERLKGARRRVADEHTSKAGRQRSEGLPTLHRMASASAHAHRATAGASFSTFELGPIISLGNCSLQCLYRAQPVLPEGIGTGPVTVSDTLISVCVRFCCHSQAPPPHTCTRRDMLPRMRVCVFPTAWPD